MFTKSKLHEVQDMVQGCCIRKWLSLGSMILEFVWRKENKDCRSQVCDQSLNGNSCENKDFYIVFEGFDLMKNSNEL